MTDPSVLDLLLAEARIALSDSVTPASWTYVRQFVDTSAAAARWVDVDMDDQRAIHSVIAHPLLILCPPLGEWLHERTEP